MVDSSAPDSTIIEVHGRSHVGIVREDNQDSIQIRDDNADFGRLYGVADGMGGYSHGGIASSLALQTLFETFYGDKPAKPAQSLKAGVQNANIAIFKAAQKMGVVRMGTTLTAVNIAGDKMTTVHIGDSRAYLIRENSATCLTNDHTQVGEMVRMRILSPDKVRTHANRSSLNKCLGIELMVQPDIIETRVRAGDTIILCTDGVWSVVEDDEFAHLASVHSESDALSQAILDLAIRRETDDNISAVAVQIRQLAEQTGSADGKRGFLRGLFSAKS